MTFDLILRLNVSAYSIVITIVAFLHYILGIHYLYKNCFKFKNRESYLNRTTYSQNRPTFLAEYDRCNPITQARASEEYLNFLKGISNTYLFCRTKT